MNDASSEARKAIAAAISSGRPTRPIGVPTEPAFSQIASSSSSVSCGRACRTWRVRVAPGATALTRIPCLAYRVASDVASWRAAAFVTA